MCGVFIVHRDEYRIIEYSEILSLSVYNSTRFPYSISVCLLGGIYAQLSWLQITSAKAVRKF